MILKKRPFGGAKLHPYSKATDIHPGFPVHIGVRAQAHVSVDSFQSHCQRQSLGETRQRRSLYSKDTKMFSTTPNKGTSLIILSMMMPYNTCADQVSVVTLLQCSIG